MTIRAEDVDRVVGGSGNILTSRGDKIGKVGEVYTDDETGEPAWVTVKTGLFGTQESFVPIRRAEVSGDDLVVPYDKDTVKDAPRIDAGGHITPEEEKRLFAYYIDADRAEGGPERSAADDDRRLGESERDRYSDANAEADQSSRPVGTPRLRRYILTEKVIPVSQEEIPVEDSDSR